MWWSTRRTCEDILSLPSYLYYLIVPRGLLECFFWGSFPHRLFSSVKKLYDSLQQEVALDRWHGSEGAVFEPPCEGLCRCTTCCALRAERLVGFARGGTAADCGDVACRRGHEDFAEIRAGREIFWFRFTLGYSIIYFRVFRCFVSIFPYFLNLSKSRKILRDDMVEYWDIPSYFMGLKCPDSLDGVRYSMFLFAGIKGPKFNENIAVACISVAFPSF